MAVETRGPQEAAQVAQATEHAETIAAIKARAEHQVSSPQRFVEAFTANIGKPTSIAVLVLGAAAWIAWNAYQKHTGGYVVDPPPFFWLQGLSTLYAALISTFVLATQNREKRHGEQRAYLELQVNLLAEQKTAKIIALLEELRRDLPSVRDRVDHQADAMQLPVDAKKVMSVLEETMDDAEEREAGAK